MVGDTTKHSTACGDTTNTVALPCQPRCMQQQEEAGTLGRKALAELAAMESYPLRAGQGRVKYYIGD